MDAVRRGGIVARRPGQTRTGPHRLDRAVASKGASLMSSRGKKKTTAAKLNREARLRERRAEKQTKKEARRAATGPVAVPVQPSPGDDDHGAGPG